MSWWKRYGSPRAWAAAGKPMPPEAREAYERGPHNPGYKPEPKEDDMPNDPGRDARHFDQFSPLQRAQLKRDDPKAYARMRSSWCRANGFPEEMSRVIRAGGRVISKPAKPLASHDGKAYEDHSPAELHALKVRDEGTFQSLRRSWLERGQPRSLPDEVA